MLFVQSLVGTWFHSGFLTVAFSLCEIIYSNADVSVPRSLMRIYAAMQVIFQWRAFETYLAYHKQHGISEKKEKDLIRHSKQGQCYRRPQCEVVRMKGTPGLDYIASYY